MRPTSLLRNALLATALLGVAAPARAQMTAMGPDPDVVDRVVAVVGDSTVLLSQLLEQIEIIRLQDASSVPGGPGPAMDRFQQQVLDNMVDQLVILRAAVKDTLVKVDEDRVQDIVNQELDKRTAQFPGGRTAMLDALQKEGMTLAQYRENLQNQVRQSQLYQMYMQRQIQNAAPAEVSDAELHEAFDQARSRMAERPKLITFEQVVIQPTPSDSAKEAARKEAQVILDSIRGGADFADMARRYSQDPGSAQNGGDLDWFRRGQMVRPFEDAAFALRDGEVSDVVETEFGFHIIKVERSRQGERKGRHILIRAAVGPGDLERARLRADSVLKLAQAGTPMEDLYDKYSDQLAPDTITVPYDQLSQLPPGYEALQTATQGQILGPIEYDSGSDGQRLAVLRVREIREAGAYTFDDVKPQLVQQLQQQKQRDRIIKRLREKTHIEILM